jgi:biopolymer transport protein TolR
MKTNPYSRPNARKVNATMNVVPYIDVMLVLLVIFMVTAPMLTTGVDIDLPKAQTKALSQGTQLPVIVSLKSNGEIYLSYQDKTDEPMSKGQLIDTLQQLQRLPEYQLDGKPNVNVMINADQQNQYGDIMQLMASLQQAGIQKVGLLTAPTKPANPTQQ